jgi:group I intron endonuclease
VIEDRKSGIFAIKNIPNGKMYIGESSDLRVTKSQYLNGLRKGTFANKDLQEDFNIFNEDEFEFQVVEYCPLEELHGRKLFYIKFYGTNNKEAGYNIMAEPRLPYSLYLSDKKQYKEVRKEMWREREKRKKERDTQLSVKE